MSVPMVSRADDFVVAEHAGLFASVGFNPAGIINVRTL
jgi:hypothetical protein